MTETALDPLPEDVSLLLERARHAPEAFPELQAKVRVRLQLSVPAAFPAPAPHGSLSALRSLGSHLIAPVATLVLGGGAGAFLHARFAPRLIAPAPISMPVAAALPPVPIPVGVPAAAPILAPTAALPGPAPAVGTRLEAHPKVAYRAPAPSPTPVTMPAPAVAPVPAAMSADRSLAAENELLERARVALTRGEPAAALEAIALHRQRYPEGPLSEECSALRVRALVQADRASEARAEAEAFQRRFPDSLLGPAIAESLSQIP